MTTAVLVATTLAFVGHPTERGVDPRHESTVRLAGQQDGYYFDYDRQESRRHHDQWSLRAIEARAAWPLTRGLGTTVAVVDSGIGPTWELSGRVVGGVNLAGRPPARVDVVDHGTAVASLIAARADGRGITGVAPRAELLSVRVFDSYVSPTARLIRGIRWAVRRRVDVLNLSLVEKDSPALRVAIRRAVRRGVIVVAGVGNDRGSGNAVGYPAAYPGVIAVGAIGRDERLADFSSVGDYVDVVAPGDRVLAADPFGTLSWYSGTSFATPVVAGVVALMKAVNPGLGVARTEQILRSTARDLGPPGPDPLYGAGVVDARRAVLAARRLARSA